MEKLIFIILMALVGCGQEKSAKRVNPESTRAIITMAVAEQEKAPEDKIPEVSASVTPAVIITTEPNLDQDQSQGDTEQTDQIPEVSIIKSPAQNVSQNDCLPSAKIPCVS